MKDSIFKPWSGPPRTSHQEHDARMRVIDSSNGIDSILKRAMGTGFHCSYTLFSLRPDQEIVHPSSREPKH
eukprot:766462-Hanusia_phi.AAC.5